jgi:hypothetical protein
MAGHGPTTKRPHTAPYDGYGVAADLPIWHRIPLSALTATYLRHRLTKRALTVMLVEEWQEIY